VEDDRSSGKDDGQLGCQIHWSRAALEDGQWGERRNKHKVEEWPGRNALFCAPSR